jgi:hypothetical protein
MGLFGNIMKFKKMLIMFVVAIASFSNAYAFKIGDTVYVPGEKNYYSEASVETIQGEKIRVSIIRKCWKALANDTYCRVDDNAQYRVGNYYWVDNNLLLSSVPDMKKKKEGKYVCLMGCPD